MVELHGGNILCQIADERVKGGVTLGHEAAPHQGKRVVIESRANTGDEATCQHGHRYGATAKPAKVVHQSTCGGTRRLRPKHPEAPPHKGSIKGKGGGPGDNPRG